MTEPPEPPGRPRGELYGVAVLAAWALIAAFAGGLAFLFSQGDHLCRFGC